MWLQVPVSELDGLGVELEKLSELEAIKEEWQLQAEAQDEVGGVGGSDACACIARATCSKLSLPTLISWAGQDWGRL